MKESELWAKCLRSLMFSDDQILLVTNEDNLERMLHSLSNIVKQFKMEILIKKKYMVFKGTWSVRSKIVSDNKIIE